MTVEEDNRKGMEGWMHSFKHENPLGEMKSYNEMKVSGDITGSTKIKRAIEYVKILKPNRQIDLEPLYANKTIEPIFNEDGSYTEAGRRLASA